MTAEQLATIEGWVGRSPAGMDCWQLVRNAYKLRSVILPGSYHVALAKGMFRTVFEPEPFDLVPVCNHRLEIVNHVMLVLPGSTVIHWLDDEHGVISHPLSREPWFSRIAREREGLRRKGFLRLRQ